MGTYTAYCLQIVLELYVGIKIRIKIGIEYKNLKWAIEDGIDSVRMSGRVFVV